MGGSIIGGSRRKYPGGLEGCVVVGQMKRKEGYFILREGILREKV